MLGRCPNCGTGPLFDGYLRSVTQCEDCGAKFPSDAAADGPAVFIMMIVGFFVVAGVLITEVTYAPPIWVHIFLWGPLAAGLCLGLLRPLKALFISLQYRHDAREGEVSVEQDQP